MEEKDLVIIGGGAAGMAAAVSAFDQGIKDILIIERSEALGGVLHQCIHNGFGIHRFREDLTGVEFARRYMDMVEERKIPYLLNTFVIQLSKDRVITAVNPEKGLLKIHAKAIILAMGCRERSRNAILIPGTRGAGILTAGTAQRYLNIEGYLPGKSVVIVGSGDIGLIMARQLVLEGVEVKAVVEIMPYSGGLPRNMKQCIEDFGIPVYYNSVISEIHGRERVTSVTVSRVDEKRQAIPGTEFEIPCDTVLISAGLIPENELTEQAGIRISKATKGAEVTEDNQTSVHGIFSCGNVLHVHDLVDFVAEEGEATGRNAAEYVKRMGESDTADYPASEKICTSEKYFFEPKTEDLISVENGSGVNGIVPQYIHRQAGTDKITLMFRPRGKYRNAHIKILDGENVLYDRKALALVPGEMCKVILPADKVRKAGKKLVAEIET